MARDSTGKWVERAGSTGGGRTYRGQMPVNWYAGLAIIIVVGIASIVFARYQYQNPTSNSSTPPTVGTTWYAGSAFDVCGTQQPALAANATSAKSSGFYTTGQGVITISPTKASQAGTNATLSAFVDHYPKLVVTQNEVQLPGETAYTNGNLCPKGTPDAGKKGEVQVVYWSNALAQNVKPVTVSGDPGTLLFTQNQLITIAFVPSGTKVPKPSGTVVSALLKASLQTSTATTTPSVSTSSLPTGSTVVTTPTGSTVVPTPTVPATAATTTPSATTAPHVTTPTASPKTTSSSKPATTSATTSPKT